MRKRLAAAWALIAVGVLFVAGAVDLLGGHPWALLVVGVATVLAGLLLVDVDEPGGG